MQIFTVAFTPLQKKPQLHLSVPAMQCSTSLMPPQESKLFFTQGTTASINLVAATWGRQNIQAGDEIIISAMEHHSNIVPWQILCEEKKASLKNNSRR